MTPPHSGRFPESVLAAHATFRALVDALARPGTVCPVPSGAEIPRTLAPAAAAIALSLLDQDTNVWLDKCLATQEVTAWLRFHTGAPVVNDSAACDFALVGDPAAMPELAQFQLGTTEYPDRATTIVLQLESLSHGPELMLRGPGIHDHQAIRVSGLPARFADRWADNGALFPRGVDLLLIDGHRVAALPRSVRMSMGD